jgi:hypothetical protein
LDDDWRQIISEPVSWNSETTTVREIIQPLNFPVNGMAGAYALGFVYTLFLCPYEKLLKLVCRSRGIITSNKRNRVKRLIDTNLGIQNCPDNFTIQGNLQSFGSVLRNALAHNDAFLEQGTRHIQFRDGDIIISVDSPRLCEWAESFAHHLIDVIHNVEFRRTLRNEPLPP